MGGEAARPDPGGGSSRRRPGGRLSAGLDTDISLPTPQPRPALLSEDPAAPGGEGAARPPAPLCAAPAAAPALAASAVAGYAGWGRVLGGKISGERRGLWAGPGSWAGPASGAGPKGADLGLDSPGGRCVPETVPVAGHRWSFVWGGDTHSSQRRGLGAGPGGGAWRGGLRMPRILRRRPGAGTEAG